jgi:uncharacterized protein YdeI (BOF family)
MLKTTRRLIIAALTLAAVIGVPAAAGEDPYLQPNNTWISLSGIVESTAPDSFLLDYGDGLVTVEMDDGDRDADGYKLIEGDKVTVSGMIDDDLYETTSIEASSVYVESIGTYFYASAIDDEDTFITLTTPVVVADTRVQGVVTEVRVNEFDIDTGLRKLTVEVDELMYDPLDDDGYQRIEAGDLVSVRGHLDHDFFEGRELEAESIIELAD